MPVTLPVVVGVAEPGMKKATPLAASESAGAFSVVFEAVAEPLAGKLTAAVHIPTIGIGASVACDGQILVLEDMLGLSPRVPKFVKRYADIHGEMVRGLSDYASEVRSHHFPEPDNVYSIEPAELAEFKRYLDQESLASQKAWDWEPLP